MKILKIALLSLALGAPGQAADPDDTIPSLPQVLAEDFNVIEISGETVPLSGLLAENRPVVIEFWATWCVPCRKTLPHLIELHQENGDDLTILGLTVEDPEDDRERVRSFANNEKVTFPMAFAPNEVFQFMNNRSDIAVPKLFIFDANGELVKYIPRYSPFTPGKLRRAVRAALSGT